eukprot:GEMP01004022.1.p1 GENE.GEMP01004022.1~~GEMP01004022.1.p1  ORF type:complete len:1264 (+),score=310.85 GEMP01004022.1:172-3963(+)
MAETGVLELNLPKAELELAGNVTNMNNAIGEEAQAHTGDLPASSDQKNVNAATASVQEATTAYYEPGSIAKGINLKGIGLNSHHTDGSSSSYGKKGQKRDQKGGWKGRKQDTAAGKRRSYVAPAFQLPHIPLTPYLPQLPAAWNGNNIQPFGAGPPHFPAADSFAARKGYHQHPSNFVYQHHQSLPPSLALHFAAPQLPVEMGQPVVGKGWSDMRSSAASLQPPPGLGWNEEQQRQQLFDARKGEVYNGADGGMMPIPGKAWDPEQQHAHVPYEQNGADGGMGQILHKAWTFEQEPQQYGHYQHQEDVCLQQPLLSDNGGNEVGFYNQQHHGGWSDYPQHHPGWNYTQQQHVNLGWANTEPPLQQQQHKGWNTNMNGSQGKDGHGYQLHHKGGSGKYRHDKGWSEDHQRAKGWSENQQWKGKNRDNQDYANKGMRHDAIAQNGNPASGKGKFNPYRRGLEDGILAALNEEAPMHFSDAGGNMHRFSQPPSMPYSEAPTTTPLAASYCGTSTPHNIFAPPNGQQETASGPVINLPLFIPPSTQYPVAPVPDGGPMGVASPARTRTAPSPSPSPAPPVMQPIHCTLPTHPKGPITPTTTAKALIKQVMAPHSTAPSSNSTPFSWVLFEQQQQLAQQLAQQQQQQQLLLQQQQPSKAAVPVAASPATAQPASPKVPAATTSPKHARIMLPLKKAANGQLVPISPVSCPWKQQEQEPSAAQLENQVEEWNPWATHPPFAHSQPGEEQFRVTADDFPSMEYKISPWDPEGVVPPQQQPAQYWPAPLPAPSSDPHYPVIPSSVPDHPPSLAMAAPPHPPPDFSASAPEFVSKVPFGCQQSQQRHEAVRENRFLDTSIPRPSAVSDPLTSNRNVDPECTDEGQQQLQPKEKASLGALIYHDGIKEFVPSWMTHQQLQEEGGHQNQTWHEYNGTTFYSWHHDGERNAFPRKPLWPERCDNELDYADSLVLRIPELNNKLMPNLSQAKPWNALRKSGQWRNSNSIGEDSENDGGDPHGAAASSGDAVGGSKEDVEEPAEEAKEPAQEATEQARAEVIKTPSIDLIRSEYCFMKTRCEAMVAEYLGWQENKEELAPSKISAYGEQPHEEQRQHDPQASCLLQLEAPEDRKKYHKHPMSAEVAFTVPAASGLYPHKTSEQRTKYSKHRPMYTEAAETISASSWQYPKAPREEQKKYPKRHKEVSATETVVGTVPLIMRPRNEAKRYVTNKNEEKKDGQRSRFFGTHLKTATMGTSDLPHPQWRRRGSHADSQKL